LVGADDTAAAVEAVGVAEIEYGLGSEEIDVEQEGAVAAVAAAVAAVVVESLA
jgi:hypothetical protein